MITEELQKLYQSYTGVPAENIAELPSSGSNRRYLEYICESVYECFLRKLSTNVK